MEVAAITMVEIAETVEVQTITRVSQEKLLEIKVVVMETPT